MSARPSVPRLEGEELDLLISRSLDGDLSPEEKRDLETVLASDAVARRRRDDLAGIVAEAHALPSPAPPFALSTRVNAMLSGVPRQGQNATVPSPVTSTPIGVRRTCRRSLER